MGEDRLLSYSAHTDRDFTQRKDYPCQRAERELQIVTGTHEVLDYINTVVDTTLTPSWITTVPKAFGESKTGTLKADEWRSYATIYLPIALVLLWNEGASHPSPAVGDALQATLDHTMHLVQALCLGCYRTTTRSRADRMHHYLRTYLSQLKDFHPQAKRLGNQHMSLHLASYMKLFGPVYSWWTYPFERLIGRLQQMPTNGRFGT